LADAKVRCPQCGAKNNLAVRCRLCGGMLPGGLDRQLEDAGGTETFSEIVESERVAWRQYDQGELSSTARSRRPPELPRIGAVEIPVKEEKRGWRRRR
jgi:hypothetical protein